MKYTLGRLGLFIIGCLCVLLGSVLLEFYPGLDIAVWLMAPIISAILAWGMKNITDAQVEERVRSILETKEDE